MTALSAARANVGNKGSNVGTAIGYKAAAATTFYHNGLVAVNAAGYLVPAASTAGLRVVGIADLQGQPSVLSGALGVTVIVVQTGIFPFFCGTSTDALTIADLMNDVFVLDDQTVGRLPGAGRPIAGQLIKVEGSNFYVAIGFQLPHLSPVAGGGTAWQGYGSEETVSAPGALSVLTHITLLPAIDGTDAFTLAAGLFVGQPKAVIVNVVGTNTPIGTVTPSPATTPATVTALGALGDSAEWVWTGAVWRLVSSFGATFT